MPRKTVLATAAAAALAALAATAHGHDVEPKLDDPISLRQNLMKQAGASMGAMGAIAKGEAEFDARVVEASLRTLHAVALGYAPLFPEGSESDPSEAGPAIWTEADGFAEQNAKFIAATAQALAMKPQSADEMKQAMGVLGQSCKSCHEGYRVKKN